MRSPSTSSKNGPPLVLVHGITASWQLFLPIIPALTLTTTLYGVDLRGHGQSGRADSYRYPDYATDIIELLEREVKEPAVILGLSMGGGVVLYVAAHSPQLIKGVIALEPVVFSEVSGIEWLVDVLAAKRELAATGKTIEEILARQGGIPTAYDRRDAKDLLALDPGTIEPFGKVMVEEVGFDGLLPKISCPAPLMHGDSQLGSVLTEEQVELVTERIADCSVDYVGGAGHVLHKNHPAETSAAVLNFLATL